MSNSISGYDIIGDIHGHAEELMTLLQEMGYSLRDHVWQHPERHAIFVGDFIDRGPQIRETLYIVKNMADAGAALAVIGNHEYNAIAFAYHNPLGGHIRKHNHKNLLQYYETIKQFQGYEKEWDDYLSWFANLPLFLELDGLRIVHACWDKDHIAELKTLNGPLTKERLIDSHDKDHPTWKIFEETLKGKEMQLPDGHFFIDKDGHRRTMCRTKWWLNPDKLTYKEYLFHAPNGVRDLEAKDHDEGGYDNYSPPVFFGHYWLEGLPALMNNNVCCTDFSVAKNGYLSAYRWSGEKFLIQERFVYV